MACSGVIGSAGGSNDGDGNGTGNGTGNPDDPFGMAEPQPLECSEADYKPASAPLRRLTPVEYERTLSSLFPGVELPTITLQNDAEVDGFDNNALSQGVSSLSVERFVEVADQVGRAVAADDSWWPCDPASDAAGCGRTLALQVGERAYRRPLEAAEEERMATFFDTLRQELGFDEAVAAYVAGVLESPDFLYRPTLGDASLPAPSGLVALTGYEMATRLSYGIWGDMPDEQLLRDADSGALNDPEQLEAAVRRMLADPRAKETVSYFHDQWLGLDRLEELMLDHELYPEIDQALREDLKASTQAFLDDAFWEFGSFREIFEGRTGFVNDNIAELAGVSPPGSQELVPVTLPEMERAGVLTQPGVLAATSHGAGHSPIFRGILVLSSVLCSPPPPPPENVDIGIDEESGGEGGTPLTTRQRLEETHGTAACATCHDAIDGIGFSFENYDGLGRFRTQENGVNVDPTGALRGEPVDNAIELASRLAGDAQARECMATQWYRFAMGRTEQQADACEIRRLADTLADIDDPQEMLVALVTSNAFRFRPEVSQ